jgi:iron complex transport system substrate-binding protein
MRYRQIGVVLLALLAFSAVPAASAGVVSTQTPSPAQAATVGQPADLAAADQHGGCEYPLEVTDASGETVVLDEEPEDVIVLAPNLAQHMWELNATEKVIGMPHEPATEYLDGRDDKADITANYQVLNERVVELDADIVLAADINTNNDAVSKLRDAGQTVYQYRLANGFDDVTEMVERTGQLVGACDSAHNVTNEMTEQINLVDNATEDVDRPTVFYDLGDDRGTPVSINSDAFEHEVLTTAGAENIAADIEASFPYPQVNPEVIIEQDPDYVVHTGNPSSFPGYNETTARANGQVIEVNGDLISQHAPRTVDVLVALADVFHPDAMEAEREARSDDNSGTTDDGSDNMNDEEPIESGPENQSDEEGDDSGPGFTGGVAVAALVALTVALLARRE